MSLLTIKFLPLVFVIPMCMGCNGCDTTTTSDKKTTLAQAYAEMLVLEHNGKLSMKERERGLDSIAKRYNYKNYKETLTSIKEVSPLESLQTLLDSTHQRLEKLNREVDDTTTR